MTDEELWDNLGWICDSGDGITIKRRPISYAGEIPLTQIKAHRFDLIERAQELGKEYEMERKEDLPRHYTDGSQGRARCAICDWTGLELEVEAVDWETEDAICPECGIDAVYLEDPEESNV